MADGPRTTPPAAAEPMVTLPASVIRAAAQALDDWTATYARDMAGDEAADAAERRIWAGGGRLAYICRAEDPLWAALKEIDHAE